MLLTKIKNWLLPPTCLLCGATTKRDIDLCFACEQDLPWLTNVCTGCSLPLPEQTPSIHCGNCLKNPPPFNKVLALFSYANPIDKFITNLKFHNRLVYAKLLGTLLANKIEAVYSNEKLPECIIPVPLHRNRLIERGFNQAVELARPIKQKLKTPLDIVSCQRIRNTSAQTQLPASQRHNNIKNAFTFNPTLPLRHVALLDDVMTTGHTIIELCYILRYAGVEKIDVWCCARTNLIG